jgi:hypothetical protein
VEFFDGKLDLAGEYFYCGEETELSYVGGTYPLIWGHNFGGSLSWDYKKMTLSAKGLYNYNYNTGAVLGDLEVDITDDFLLKVTVPMFLGSRDGTYYLDNPDTLKREAAVAIQFIMSGNI